MQRASAGLHILIGGSFHSKITRISFNNPAVSLSTLMTIPRKIFVLLHNLEGTATAVQSARLIKTQATLDKHVKSMMSSHTVHTFSSEQEALHYISENKFNLIATRLTSKQATIPTSAAAAVSAEVLDERSLLTSTSQTLEQASNTQPTSSQQGGQLKSVVGSSSATGQALSSSINQDDSLESSLKSQIDQNSSNTALANNFNDDLFCFYTQDESLVARISRQILKDSEYFMFFDGASSFNPGPSGCGFVICDRSKNLYKQSIYTGYKTNNQAEYLGMLYGLRTANDLGIRCLHVLGDSQLVINQMKGKFKVADQKLLRIHSEAMKLTKFFDKLEYQYIPRADNHVADSLASKAAATYKKK